MMHPRTVVRLSQRKPNYLARKFGALFMFGLLLDTALLLIPYTQNFWR